MGVPGAASIERMRHPTTISVSARCARISATDHLSGAGRLRNLDEGARFTSRSSLLAVADCVLTASFPSISLNIRCVYSCGVSLMSFLSSSPVSGKDGRAWPASKRLEQPLPTHFAWMNHGMRIRQESFAELPRFPGIGRSFERHVNYYRRADDIFSRNAARETAVVGISTVISHHKKQLSGTL